MVVCHRCMLLTAVVLLIVGHRRVHCRINDFSSVQSLNSYFENFFATNQSITSQQWFGALPTRNERREMKKLIKQLFEARNFKTQCSSSVISSYPSLKQFINVTLFKDKYCVIHELIPASNKGMFKRFWGYTVISDASKRAAHHSAAHFQSDGDVCDEAAAVFERSSSRSLVIAGANRYAVIGKEKNKCHPNTALADAAHNNETMFHTMNEAVFEAASNHNHNVFIQWHGMAETSCANVQAFISTGVGGLSGVYKDSMLPANRLVRHFNEMAKGAFTPATSKECNLLATTNIFGRYINGVPVDQVCSTIAETTKIHGAFVHVEQKRAIRDDWDLWTKVVRASIPSSTASSHHIGLFFLVSGIAMNI